MRAYVTIWNNDEEPTADTRRDLLVALRDTSGVITADRFIGVDDMTAIVEADGFDAFTRVIDSIEAIPGASVSAVTLARPD